MNWCDNAAFHLPLSYCLVVSEEEYKKTMGYLRIEDPNFWLLNDHSDGCAHFVQCADGSHAVVVAMKKDANPVKVLGLIAHEAVHIWQKVRELIGESQPSAEFEAYTVQRIVMNLHDKYLELCEPSTD